MSSNRPPSFFRPRMNNPAVQEGMTFGQITMPFTHLLQNFKKEMSENWAMAVEGVLIFSSLFASTVASFLALSYSDLFPDNVERTVILLGRISQQLAEISNGTATVPPLQAPPGSDIFTFKPSWSAIVVNTLWAASLLITLACALLAIYVKRWTQMYSNQNSHRDPESHDQGHELFVESLALTILPIMVHLSILLFFVGFAIFFFVASRSASYFPIAILVLCIFVYPLFISRSPH